ELGIPCKTRHNEVAPNQFELAPIYEETNLAVDHNMLIMSLMKRTARKHGFRCLLHEKPFAGINGSGKHCNWSLATDTGVLLHGPGKTPLDNLRFVTFIVESLMAVYRHNGLLKASIISATNVHRLGASEAPPAIVSSFLGKQLSDLLERLEEQGARSKGQESTDDELINLSGKQTLSLDIPQIPELTQDNTDRNRTSPFAFTGNRFEFRAVGSQQNCAAAMIVLNTAMAEALTNFKTRVDALIEEGIEPMKAILRIVRDDIKTCKPIHFDGNGYSDEWKEEASRRGLDTETSVPIILDQYLKTDTVEMFSRMNVLTKAELEARNEIKLDTYIKKVQIEARIFGDICMNHIIPVATRYQTQLIDNVHKMMAIFPAETAERLNRPNLSLIEQIGEHNAFIIENVERLIEARRVANRIKDGRERAIAYHDTVAPLIEAIRYHVDHLELIIDDELWPLPKYREMLFIH
ncbi:MAG: glutamine synthetase type III, partial [Bacteroidaceae bacterium]|nr:glutamine synthetase type III [Bacteroidaceae bacterium]